MKIRVLAFMEAVEVTGPAKNLLRFARLATQSDSPADIEFGICTFVRSVRSASDADGQAPFQRAVTDAGLPLEIAREKYRFDPRVIAQMRGVFERFKPHLVQSHGVKSHFLLQVAGIPENCRSIAFHHGYTAENAKMRLYNLANRWSLPRFDRVISVCSPFVEDLVREGVSRDKIVVLGNSIDGSPAANEDEIAALRYRFGITGDRPVILAVGRQSSEKGHADFLEALRLLAARAPKIDFLAVLLGEGPERGKLERLADDEILRGRVVLAGYFPRIGPFYRLASCFVLPSHSEGSPNVILEAMAAGVPIASTAVGGVPDMLKNGESGLLTPAGDPAALAESMHRILTDRAFALSMAAKAKHQIATRFTPQAYRDSLIGIYMALCGGISDQ